MGKLLPYRSACRLLAVLALWLLLQPAAFSAEQRLQPISKLSISKSFFSPSLRQTVQISFHVEWKGALTVQVVDPDGYLVSELVRDRSVQAGGFECEWDGKGMDGRPMPDGAYGVRIELSSRAGKEVYFPSDADDQTVMSETAGYDREAKVISYQLSQPSLVRITALRKGTDVANLETKEEPLCRVLDWTARVSGPIVETWAGYSLDRATYVPDVPGSELRVEMRPLPEGTIVVAGGHTRSLDEWKAVRSGKSLFVHRSRNASEEGARNAKH